MIAAVAMIQYEYEQRLFRVADGVFEVFDRIVDGSRRYLVEWIGVSIEERKGDQIRVQVGHAQVGAPFYTDELLTSGALSHVDLPTSELLRVRAFFDEVARQAQRAA